MNSNKRIQEALAIAHGSAGVDGAHHKMWVIDQMIRALTGCPRLLRAARDVNGNPYIYEAYGESDDYTAWVAEFCNGEDGPTTYEWDTTGTPP